jgi:hypothetical protein
LGKGGTAAQAAGGSRGEKDTKVNQWGKGKWAMSRLDGESVTKDWGIGQAPDKNRYAYPKSNFKPDRRRLS